MTPAQELSELGKVLETFPLSPVYIILLGMFLCRIRTKTLQRKGAWEQCVGVRRPHPLGSPAQRVDRPEGRAADGHI